MYQQYFMVLQVVVLWLYMSYKFLCYKFEYKNIFNKLQEGEVV